MSKPLIGSSDGEEFEINYKKDVEDQKEVLEIACLKKDIRNLQKENVMLSNTLLKTANQMEEWANQLVIGYYFQAKAMKQAVTNIRREVRETKFFRKENEDERI